MKKNICLLFAAAVMMATGVNAQTYKGDVNKDGSVDVSDVTALVDIILSDATPETEDAALQDIIDELEARIASNLTKIEAETARANNAEAELNLRLFDMNENINDNKTSIAALAKGTNAAILDQQAAIEYVRSLINDEINERQKADAEERFVCESSYEDLAAALNAALKQIAECESTGSDTMDAVNEQNAHIKDLEEYTKAELTELKAKHEDQNANIAVLMDRISALAGSLEELEQRVSALEGELR